MSLKVVIFEDDKDFADYMKDLMEQSHYEVLNCYNLNKNDWHDADIVLGDYRNKIVPFEALRNECASKGIPLIAISGADTNYSPQLIKPFQLEEMQYTILNELMKKNKIITKPRASAGGNFMARMKNFFGGQ